VPAEGRRMQMRVWRAVAEKRRGTLVVGERFHTLTVPVHNIVVTAVIADRAFLDGAIAGSVRSVEMGGWRTFLHAEVPDGAGPAYAVYPGQGLEAIGDAAFDHSYEVERLRNENAPIGRLFTPDLCKKMMALRGDFTYVAAGPALVL